MTEEKKTKMGMDAREETHNATQPSGNGHDAPSPESGQHDGFHAVSAQAQRDEEIEEIQKRSRHQPPAIQAPPELPPAPPRKALLIVGILLLAANSGRRSDDAGTHDSRACSGKGNRSGKRSNSRVRVSAKRKSR